MACVRSGQAPAWPCLLAGVFVETPLDFDCQAALGILARVIALIAPAVLGLSGAPFHDSFHAHRRASLHRRNRASRPGVPLTAMPLTWPGTVLPAMPPPALPGARETAAPAQRPGPATPPGPAAPARPPPRPAHPRPTRPGSPHRPLPRICDGARQMSAPDGSSAVPAAGITPPGSGMMPDPAGEPGHSFFGLEPHDHLRISHDRP